MLKKAIFAELSLFAAVKSRFYSVPVSAFLFPAPTKLGFFKAPFHVKQSPKWLRTFLLSVLLRFCPHAVFPPFDTPYSLAGLFQNGRRTMTRQSLIYTFRVFFAFKPVSRETFCQNAVERSRLDVFLHFKCVSRKTFSKNSPRRHAFWCLETVSCKKLSKADCHRPFAMTFTFYVSRETFSKNSPRRHAFWCLETVSCKKIKSQKSSPVCNDFYFLCFTWNIRDRTSQQKEKARESGE